MSKILTHNRLHEIILTYGSPLYIFNKESFTNDYYKLLNTFKRIYPKYNIAYSYKTNYTPHICKLVKKFGGLAEVVSDMEYRLAKKIGYENKRIIYNGPVKGEGLFDHLRHGGVVNIDNLDEMRRVVSFAKEHLNINVRIAYRVNIDIGQGFISRFGLDAYENKEIWSELDVAHEMLSNVMNITLVGLHCHIGRSRDTIAWHNRVRIMFNLVDRLFDDTPEFIDFGSGMNSIMDPMLAKQFGCHIPTFSEYANILAIAMQDKYSHLPFEQQPYLYTEPGTTVISRNMSFVATVESIKKVKGKIYVTLDCSGGNIGDICQLKQLPVEIYHNGGELINCNDANFVGYTCLEHDHIYRNYSGKIAVGDYIQFGNIGSYSNVFKPPFILPNCAMIQIDKYENTQLIKAKETMDDILKTYIF